MIQTNRGQRERERERETKGAHLRSTHDPSYPGNPFHIWLRFTLCSNGLAPHHVPLLTLCFSKEKEDRTPSRFQKGRQRCHCCFSSQSNVLVLLFASAPATVKLLALLALPLSGGARTSCHVPFPLVAHCLFGTAPGIAGHRGSQIWQIRNSALKPALVLHGFFFTLLFLFA